MPDNSFAITSAHLFSHDKNVGAHSFAVQKSGLRAARQTFAVGLWALRLPGLARRSR